MAECECEHPPQPTLPSGREAGCAWSDRSALTALLERRKEERKEVKMRGKREGTTTERMTHDVGGVKPVMGEVAVRGGKVRKEGKRFVLLQ